MNSINKPKKISWNGNEKFDCKTKRPRISINSDDEDDKNVRVKLPITMKETAKPITKDLPKINKKSTSRVIVFKPLESKVSYILYTSEAQSRCCQRQPNL